MLFATVGQGSVFVWMLSAGFLMGVLYDVFRLFRWMLGGGTAASVITDTLWGAAAGGVFCGMLYYANYGVLRLYSTAAAGIGLLLYLAAVSDPVSALCRRAAKAAGRAVAILSKFLPAESVFK